jgi:hypothetical protein
MEKLLASYSATRTPSAPHSRVVTTMCWRCNRPNLYDARRARPSRCAWCRAAL